MANIIRAATATTVHTGAENVTESMLHTGASAGGVGLAAIASIVLSQMEYNDRKDELKELYRDELAAQLGKSPESVTADDFDRLAERNHTVREQLEKTKKERNVGIGVIATGTLAAAAAAFGIMSLLTSGSTVVLATFATKVTMWLATTAVGMMAYGLIKTPIRKLGEKLFGIDKKTTHERIEGIYKDHDVGKVISRERVFDVFVHANPPLQDFIKKEYGKNFDKLKPVDKLQLADTIGVKLGVAELTDAINKGKIKSTELAFTVDGKYSGVAPKQGDQPKHTLMEKVSETVHHAAEKVHHAAEVFTGHHPADNKPEGFSFAEREKERRAVQTQLHI